MLDEFLSIVNNDNFDNFVPEITPWVKKFAKFTKKVRDQIEERQNRHKHFADRNFSNPPLLKQGNRVWVTVHSVSNSNKICTSTFMPRCDGPYTILTQRSAVSYTVAATIDNPSSNIGHVLL